LYLQSLHLYLLRTWRPSLQAIQFAEKQVLMPLL